VGGFSSPTNPKQPRLFFAHLREEQSAPKQLQGFSLQFLSTRLVRMELSLSVADSTPEADFCLAVLVCLEEEKRNQKRLWQYFGSIHLTIGYINTFQMCFIFTLKFGDMIQFDLSKRSPPSETHASQKRINDAR